MASIPILIAMWAVACARAWGTFVRGPRPVWRVSFALGLLAVAIGQTVRCFPQLVDARFPNLGEVTAYILMLLAAGAIRTYLRTLTATSVSWLILARDLGVASGLGVLCLCIWATTPSLHAVPVSPSLQVAPASLPLLALVVTVYVPITLVLLRVGLYCLARLRGGAARQPGETLGLSLIGLCALLGITSFVGSILNVLIRLNHASGIDHLLLSRLNGACLGGLALGAAILFVAPPLQERQAQRRNARTLRPLWSLLVRRYPQVRLSRGRNASYIRMLIETHDSLMLAPVRHTSATGFEMLAESLHSSSSRSPTGESVGRALLRLDQSGDDAVLALAHTFNRRMADAHHTTRQHQPAQSAR